ncbi:MAG: class I SAM-dependent methyltransferase [Dehalococcoidia bacterium]|nr:class I SAM-dependent methyltransferase [Dehalococcoidia bacterium]MDD5493167.1 class I SAM-dependent methyltransferase [Dehalococcoidia bacterium]
MPEKIPWPFTRLYDRGPNRFFTRWFQRIASDVRERGITGNILDIGTGPGRLPIEIAKQVKDARLFGVDLSQDMIKIARENAGMEGIGDRVEFRMASAYATGFESGSMDLVVSTETLHHLAKPLAAFNEIYRILKPGGQAWLFDGRKDASKAEYEETARMLGIVDLPLPYRFFKTMWPRAHTGYKTEVYTTGKLGKAIETSPFKKAKYIKQGAYIRIELKKH